MRLWLITDKVINQTMIGAGKSLEDMKSRCMKYQPYKEEGTDTLIITEITLSGYDIIVTPVNPVDVRVISNEYS